MHLAFAVDLPTPAHTNQKKWHPLPPSPQIIQRAIQTVQEEAFLAPSTFKFYLLGKHTSQALAWVYARGVEEESNIFKAIEAYEYWHKIPGHVLITCKRTGVPEAEAFLYERTCTAAQKFVLSLWSEHIATEWITADQVRALDILQAAGINPEEERLVGLVGYGYELQEAVLEPGFSEEYVSQLP